MSTTLHGPEADPVAEADLATHEAKSVSQAHGTVKPADIDATTVGTGSTQVAAGNDSRFPSAGQKNALAGSSGIPGTGNEYLTKQDKNVANGVAALTSDRVVPPAYGGFPIFGVTQARFGADKTGAADSRPAFLAAIQAMEAAGGGTVHAEAGTYLLNSTGPLPLAVDFAGGWRHFSGYGATIKIGAGMGAGDRGFLVPNRTADDQTFAKLLVEGFNIDGNKSSALASEGLRGSNIFRASGTKGQRMNFADLIFRDIYSYGLSSPTTYGDGTGTFNNQTHLYIASGHTTQGEAQNAIKRVTVERVRMERGVGGAFVGANVASGTGAEVFLDEIVMEKSSMDFQDLHTQNTGSGFGVGSQGFGNRAVIRDCYVNKCNDTACEIDGMQDGLIENCTGEDSRNASFLFKNFHAAQDANKQRSRVIGCTNKITTMVPDGVTYHGHGADFASSSTMGQCIVRDFTLESTSADALLDRGQAVYVNGGTVNRVLIDGLTINVSGAAPANPSGSSSVTAPIYLSLAAAARVRVAAVYYRLRGAAGTLTSAINHSAIQVENAAGTVDLLVDGLVYDYAITGTVTNLGSGGLYMGATSGTSLQGTIRNVRPIAGTGGQGQWAIRFGANLTINKRINVEDVIATNYTGSFTSNNPLLFSGSVQAGVDSRRILYASTAAIPPPSAAISVTGSPFSYINNTTSFPMVVTVQGGTVSKIEHGHVEVAGTNFLDTGAIAGSFYLPPADRLRVTYTVAPTMTAIPVP